MGKDGFQVRWSEAEKEVLTAQGLFESKEEKRIAEAVKEAEDRVRAVERDEHRKAMQRQKIIFTCILIGLLFYVFRVEESSQVYKEDAYMSVESLSEKYVDLREEHFAVLENVVAVYKEDLNLYYHTVTCSEYTGVAPLGYFDTDSAKELGLRACPVCWDEYMKNYPDVHKLLKSSDFNRP